MNEYRVMRIKLNLTTVLAATVWLTAGTVLGAAENADKPNMVFILADDMGYGDVSHAGGLAPTPSGGPVPSDGGREQRSLRGDR